MVDNLRSGQFKLGLRLSAFKATGPITPRFIHSQFNSPTDGLLVEWEHFYNFDRSQGAFNVKTHYGALRDKLQSPQKMPQEYPQLRRFVDKEKMTHVNRPGFAGGSNF